MLDKEPKETQSFMETAECLYRENYSYIYKVVFFMVRDKNISDDLVQESFYKAFKKMDQLRDSNKFRAWLTAIAINLCRDYIKKSKKELPAESLIQHTADGNAETQLVQSIMRNEIEDVLGQLAYEEKEIIMLKYYFGFSSREIAQYYRISEESVNARVFRAKNKFKKKHQLQPGKEA